MTRLVAALALALVLGSVAEAQQAVVTSQTSNSKNQEAVSAANAAVAITLTAPAATRAHLSAAAVRCSAGSASLTVTDGGTTIWTSDAAFVGTTTKTATWVPALTGGVAQAMVVTLGTCGVGNVGTLDIQADVF